MVWPTRRTTTTGWSCAYTHSPIVQPCALLSWHPVNDRILVARLRHRFGILAVVVVYAPTNEASPSVKDDFYQTLESAMLLTKTNDLVICLGDFNAITGPRSTTPGPVGLFGSGSANDNSDRFVSFCEGAQLRIAGSWFRRKDIHRYTWFSNDGRTCKEIDHILVNRRWSAVTNCRVYRKLEFNAVIHWVPVILSEFLCR